MGIVKMVTMEMVFDNCKILPSHLSRLVLCLFTVTDWFSIPVFMVFHGFMLVFMIFHNSRLFFIIFHSSILVFMVFHGFRLVLQGSMLGFHGCRLVFIVVLWFIVFHGSA